MSSIDEIYDVELEENSKFELWKEPDKANYYLNRLQKMVRHWSASAAVAEKQDAIIDDLARQVTFYRKHAREVETKLKEAEARARVAESAVRLYQDHVRDQRKERTDRLERGFEVSREERDTRVTPFVLLVVISWSEDM